MTTASPWLAIARERMLAQLRREIRDERVIAAMAAVPRERFVPAELEGAAYDDRALAIGGGQTISQPLMVALMVEAAQIQPADRVLEIGTGSGYAAAVMSQLAAHIVTIERVPKLAQDTRATLKSPGYAGIDVFDAEAALGWAAAAPYDAIIVSAGAPRVPRLLLDQLAECGRLVVPVGDLRSQELVRASRTSHGIELTWLGACAFVPLIGADGWRDDQVNDASGRLSLREPVRIASTRSYLVLVSIAHKIVSRFAGHQPNACYNRLCPPPWRIN